VDELQAIRNDMGGDYILANDIDASETETWRGGAGFYPIGRYGSSNPNNYFRGTLDGQGYEIIGLHIRGSASPWNFLALFGGTRGATITNVGLRDTHISGTGYVASLVSGAENTTISKCYSKNGQISTGSMYAAGLIAQALNSPIADCYVEGGTVRAGRIVGGLVGRLISTTAGGSVGNIATSYSTAEVISNELVLMGGLVGWNQWGKFTNCYYDTETAGQSDTGKGEPKTTAEMEQKSTFVNWDFHTIWGIDEGISYPYFGPNPFIDIGLRVYDGTETVKIACEPDDSVTSPLRIAKDGKVYGIALVDPDNPPNNPDATKIRIKTSSGVMAPRKYE